MENPSIPEVIIVGAGPSGLAAAASLTVRSIPYILLERQNCFAPLWNKYSYDRLHLHLRKQFCELPHMPFPSHYPTYVPKQQFLEYLEAYVAHFRIIPKYNRHVEVARYEEDDEKWRVKVKDSESGEVEEYSGRFLVVASGETTDPFVPEVDGLKGFSGEVIHSTQYRNGACYSDKKVLVVGSGNSGMEIALDLANCGAKTSLVVRSPVHVLSRDMVYMGLVMLKHLRLGWVDSLLVMISWLVYGDLTKYGISRPQEGPFFIKVARGKYPLIDVGTISKIKSGEIEVLPAVESLRGREVVFQNGKSHHFDVIIFCTGFKRATSTWLKGDDYLLTEDGLAKNSFPNHWKGRNGLYGVGLARRGLYGANADAQNIANDIKSLLQ